MTHPFQPVTRVRPVRADNGDGTFTETVDVGTGVTVYAAMVVHDDRTFMTCSRHDDVQPADVVVADGANYRVVRRAESLGDSRVRFELERTTRPLTP
jgi:hypothetical protein